MTYRTYLPTPVMTKIETKFIRKEGDKYAYGRYVERKPIIDGFADTYEEAAKLSDMDTPAAPDLRPKWFK